MNLHLHPPRWNLIVNADDLGAHPARDAAILELAAAGRVSSASLLVNAAHSATAARKAATIGLHLGLHLNLSEGVALTGASSLTSGQRCFHGKFGLRERLASGGNEAVIKIDIGREIRAQIEQFRSLVGHLPDHVDSHQHIHVHPRVAPLLAAILGEEFGIRRLRLPLEHPADAIPETDPEMDFHAEISCDAAAAAPLFAAQGILWPDTFIGLSSMGEGLSVDVVRRTLAGIRARHPISDGTRLFVELMCHPGRTTTEGSDFDRAPARCHENAVLRSDDFAAACAPFLLTTFSEIEQPYPAKADSGPRFLILSKLDASTGNHTTALALKARLAGHGSVFLHPLAEGVPDDDACTRLAVRELDALLRRERIDFILGIQAQRCGELLRRLRAAGGPDVPYALLFSGTDANEDLADPARSAAIGESLAAAGCSFALSTDLADAVARRFPDLPRPRVITADGEITTNSNYQLREHLGLPPTARILLLPAGIRPVKNILLALDALTAFLCEQPDHLLLILGPVLDTAYHTRCLDRRSAIERAHPHLAGRLRIEPGLPRADYLAALRQSDYLINTSHSEGRPNAVLEAMGCGVPVIARDIAGNRQFVRDGESGLLFTDAPTFSAACHRLAGGPDLYARLAAGGRDEYARQHTLPDNDTLFATIDTALAARTATINFGVGSQRARLTLSLATGTNRPSPENSALFEQVAFSAAASRRWQTQPPRCLDLGCGSGIFGITALERLHALGLCAAQMVCADNEADTLDALALTIRRHRPHFAARVRGDIRLACGDLFSAITDEAPFDLVVANLPQTPGPQPFRNDRCGFNDRAELLTAFIAALPSHLACDGEAFVLYIGLANPARVMAAIAAAGLVVESLSVTTRSIAATEYDCLEPSIRPLLTRLRTEGRCEFDDSELDDQTTIRFAVSLLRLRRA